MFILSAVLAASDLGATLGGAIATLTGHLLLQEQQQKLSLMPAHDL